MTIEPDSETTPHPTQNLVVLTLVPIRLPGTITDTTKDSSMLPYAEPPSGIPIFKLDAIDVTLRTSTSCNVDPSSKRLRPIHNSNEGGHPHEEEIVTSEPAGSCLGPLRRCEPACEDNDTTDQECRTIWDVAHSPQDCMTCSDSSQSAATSLSSYSSGTLQEMESSDEIKSQEMQVKAWSKMADAALRTMIGGSSTLRTDGVKLSSDSGGPKLAEIAPALFSPFYAEAMTQRSMLFPTISRGLSAIYGRTQSAHLKGLIEQSTQLSLDERLLLTQNDSDFEKHGRTLLSLNAVVKLRLWRLAQRALFDPRATRRLKATRHVGELFLYGIGAEAMLDGAGHTNAQLGAMPLTDECNYETNWGNINQSTGMVGIDIDNESLLLEVGSSCLDDMLEMDGSAESGDEMLDGPFLGLNVVCDDEEFLWNDEILNEDSYKFEDFPMDDTVQVDSEDLDDDLLWKD